LPVMTFSNWIGDRLAFGVFNFKGNVDNRPKRGLRER
jgi:hypothetical protein